MKRVGVVLILLFAFFGLSDSLYIAQSEATNTPLLCTVDNLSGCNIVAASQYSRFLGISVAEYGVMFYAFLFVIAALELILFDRLLRRILQVTSVVGVGASIYLTFLEVFVIRALCIYCIASALIALFVFVAATLIEPIKKVEKHI